MPPRALRKVRAHLPDDIAELRDELRDEILFEDTVSSPSLAARLSSAPVALARRVRRVGSSLAGRLGESAAVETAVDLVAPALGVASTDAREDAMFRQRARARFAILLGTNAAAVGIVTRREATDGAKSFAPAALGAFELSDALRDLLAANQYGVLRAALALGRAAWRPTVRLVRLIDGPALAVWRVTAPVRLAVAPLRERCVESRVWHYATLLSRVTATLAEEVRRKGYDYHRRVAVSGQAKIIASPHYVKSA